MTLAATPIASVTQASPKARAMPIRRAIQVQRATEGAAVSPTTSHDRLEGAPVVSVPHDRHEERRGDDVAEAEEAVGRDEGGEPAIDTVRAGGPRRRRACAIGDESRHDSGGDETDDAAAEPDRAPATTERDEARRECRGDGDADTDAGEVDGGKLGPTGRGESVEDER
jgi:hypothetical protein